MFIQISYTLHKLLLFLELMNIFNNLLVILGLADKVYLHEYNHFEKINHPLLGSILDKLGT